MYLLTLITRKTRASSSKRPLVEEIFQEEEDNLSKHYKAKFLILSHAKGAKLTTIRFREILACKYMPTTLLTKVGMFDVFDNMLSKCSLKKFVSMQEDIYNH